MTEPNQPTPTPAIDEAACPIDHVKCEACKEPTPWNDTWELTHAHNVGNHTLVSYRLVCTKCMTKHAPMLVIILAQDD